VQRTRTMASTTPREAVNVPPSAAGGMRSHSGAGALLSLLQIDSGLGLPDSLRHLKNGSKREMHLDLSRNVLQEVMAKALLGENLWQLHNQLSSGDFFGPGDHGVQQVVFNYAVEPVDSRLLRSSSTELTVPYESPVTDKCYVGYGGTDIRLEPGALSACEYALEQHSHGLNANTSIGVGRETLHYQSVRSGAQLEVLFTRLWLVHLSVLAGSVMTVQVDQAVHKIGLRGVPVEDECDRARLLKGVRLNGQQLDRPGMALMVVACSQMSGQQGLHPRAARYRFPSVPLTFYGSTAVGTFNVQLRDASSTSSTIVALSSRYGAQAECGAALRTALVMFGMARPGAHVLARAAAPDVHDDTHLSVGGTLLPHYRSNELAESRLLSLSLFMGRTYSQLASHILRAGLLKVTSMDVDAARDHILPGHAVMMKAAASLHDDAFQHYSVNICSRTFISENYRSLWNERGVLHCLAAGIVVQDTTLEEVVKPIAVPDIKTSMPTDDPAYAKALKEDWGVFTLIEDLVSVGGEQLCGSAKARVKQLAGQLRLSRETRALCGSTVVFTLLSMGDEIYIQRDTTNLAVISPDDAEREFDQPVIEPVVLPQLSVAQLAPEQQGESLLDDMLDKLVPHASTMARRPQVGESKLRAPTWEPVYVAQALTGQWYDRITKQGWGVVAAEGSGIMSGARAVHTTLTSMNAEGTASQHIMPQVTEAMSTALSPEQAEMMHATGELPTNHSFTAEQMAAGLQRLSTNYSLRVIQENGDGSVNTYVVGGMNPDTVEVPVHHVRNVWSGFGAAKYRELAVKPQQRQHKR